MLDPTRSIVLHVANFILCSVIFTTLMAEDGPPKQVDPQTASLADALADWINLLEKADLKTATQRWAGDDAVSGKMSQEWQHLQQAHKHFDYRKWIHTLGAPGGAKNIADATTFTVGGHDHGHRHIVWTKTQNGWRITKIWLCR